MCTSKETFCDVVRETKQYKNTYIFVGIRLCRTLCTNSSDINIGEFTGLFRILLHTLDVSHNLKEMSLGLPHGRCIISSKLFKIPSVFLNESHKSSDVIACNGRILLLKEIEIKVQQIHK
jgi:hypothetical protein